MFKISIFRSEDNSESLRKKYHGADSLPLKVSIKAAWRMIKLYWGSKDSLGSWFLLFLIVCLTGGAIYLAKIFNTWYKEFWDTIQNYQLEEFKYQLMMFAILATIHVVVSVNNAYLRSKLAIRWRKWFTSNVMHDYLGEDTYYKMNLEDRKTENPDQRISEDLRDFVTSSISLIIGTVSDLAMLGTFGVVLWDLSHAATMTLWNGYELHLPDGYMLYLAIAYAFVGTILTFWIGKPLVKLNFRQQRYEADFRFSLIRLRENSESVALYKGSRSEEVILDETFISVVKNYIKLIKKEKRLGFFTLGYAQTAVIFPILISAPMYFAKIITIGSIMQINSAFGRVQDSLSTIISSFSAWASYKAVIDRLALFFDGMDSSAQIDCLKPSFDVKDTLRISSLNVSSPHEELLWRDLNLKLKHGDSVIIRGPSGCGKSTLIKTFAGIWPYADGYMRFPKQDQMLFLSQRPYLPLGTLREAISYPGPLCEDGSIEAYLQELNLAHLIPNLDVNDNWSAILSLGEQQRIAFIRALLIRPGILFMDEASSALDENLELKAYMLLKEQLPQSIIVSVGHRSTLLRMHDSVLLSQGNAQWSLIDSRDFAQSYGVSL